jgi:Fe-S oxidoreductase
MEPNRANGHCCGAGGGMLPGPYEAESAWHGHAKYESIQSSGANVLVVACSNCHDQLMKRVPKFYPDYPYEVKYLWELVADSLVLEPWSEEEIARAEAEAAAQWEKFGVEFDEE